jgi:hypothetical protein
VCIFSLAAWAATALCALRVRADPDVDCALGSETGRRWARRRPVDGASGRGRDAAEQPMVAVPDAAAITTQAACHSGIVAALLQVHGDEAAILDRRCRDCRTRGVQLGQRLPWRQGGDR